MASAKFLTSNLFASATILNGTGGSAPARSEVSPFVLEHLLDADRRRLWKAGSTPTTSGPDQWVIDFDLGSAQDVSCMATHGLSCPGGVIEGVGVLYYNSYPAGVVGISGMHLNGRDAGLTFGPFNKRYFGLVVQATAPPIIGRVVGGEYVDLGTAPNPGSISAPFRNRLEQVDGDGSVHIVERGPNGHDFDMQFDPVLDATAAQLEALTEVSSSLTYFDPRGRCFEIYVKGGRVDVAPVGGGCSSVRFQAGRVA